MCASISAPNPSFRMMLAAAALALLPASGALAQTPQFPTATPQPAPPGTLNTFTEPSEAAFTVDAPAGWHVDGGIKRFAPSEVHIWITAESPDKAIELFLGDPAIGAFLLPNPPVFREGSQIPWIHNRPATVSRYHPGGEYAGIYGMRTLPNACANVQYRSAQTLPKVEDEMREHVLNATRLDAGQASFTCESNGKPYVAGVIAGTVENLFPGGNGGGVWSLNVLRGYIAPPDREAEANQVLTQMAASVKPNPQLIAVVQAAQKAEDEAARRAMEERQNHPR